MSDKADILYHIRELKHRLLPHDQLILFGSQARNDGHEDSDWDLLILLNKKRITTEDFGVYAYPFVELGWKYGEYFSPKLYTVAEWEKRSPSLFYKNIHSEGIPIV